MFSRLFFYLRYAARNLYRSRRWTVFAVFCIASGVAAVVALRSLGLAIGDSLVENVRTQLHGDISLEKGVGFGFGVSLDEQEYFSAAEMRALEQWASDNNATISPYFVNRSAQVTAVDAVTVGRPQFVSTYLVDPLTFPPTNDLRLNEPSAATLRDALQGDNPIVISQNLAEQQGIAVGDTVRVSGTEELFTVTGIAPTEAEASLRNPFASFFGFAYLPISEAETVGINGQPNTVAIALPDGATDAQISAALNELNRRGVNFTNYDTLPEQLDQNRQIGDVIGRFIVVMGLGALLIGGVGIINTMLVMVGRRTNEIAALKTFGLKGGQVGAMFLAEAFLLGVMGSIVGCLLGLLLSGAVNRYGEAFLQQRLPTRIYPEAILFGMALGIVVTLVFGILPVLTANKIRPATILRPNETAVPAAGCLQSLITLLLVIVVIGGIAGQILGNVLVGMIGVALTLVFLAFMVGVMWVIIWMIGKLPAWGIPDLRLALRNLTSRRIRTATTLLALAAGMFALSSIAFVGAGTRELLNLQLANQFGGNVLVFPLLSVVSQDLGQGLLNLQLAGLDGIEYTTTIETYTGRIEAVNGQELTFAGEAIPEDLPRGAERGFSMIQMQVRTTTNPDPDPAAIIAGRGLTADDDGRRVMVISNDFITEGRGIEVGSILTVRLNPGEYTDFEVVGVVDSGGGLFGNVSTYTIPPNALPANPDFTLTTLQVAPENLNNVLLALSSNPTMLALDITFIDGILSRFINQFAAIPTVVGLLSLLAAAIAMANTVSLATLERRRQIGILKAVGLKSRRVLGVMLLENTLIGLLGGLLGIGLSALIVSGITALGQGVAVPIPREAMPVAIALMLAALGIALVATLLSAAPVTRERVTNVLRYE
jgi:predicted lysophospholipase L1 biosynthesis ABC-type transport system permease subunit